jgi:histidyl-tRNA synthetase
MAKDKTRSQRPEARVPKGLRDTAAREVRAMERMLSAIRDVYESYGFEPLETPAIEYTEALGKFLPDLDRPNEGVFSFQDDDEQWLSLRYDLTAPLARYVAENFEQLPKPFRRYQTGPVWRNEKPGPGRYRQFTQFDADTVGSALPAADAEITMMAADCLERVGIPRGSYVMRVNNRKILDGVLETIGIARDSDAHEAQRLTVMRAVDKLDRLGVDGVRLLLGEGRKDESGDFTRGAGLAADQIDRIIAFVSAGAEDRAAVLANLQPLVGDSTIGRDGVDELAQMAALFDAAGYGPDRIRIDPSVVRGLGYYTGPVYEAELTFEAVDDDGLVERFKGIEVPATGFSIGVSRLYTALDHLGALEATRVHEPVVVLVMDRDRIADYQTLAGRLRHAGIRAEMYLGGSGMKAQMKYADRRNSPCVVIQGGNERERGEVTIKDLIEGSRLAREIEDNVEWRESRPAQVSVPEAQFVEAVKDILARHKA